MDVILFIISWFEHQLVQLLSRQKSPEVVHKRILAYIQTTSICRDGQRGNREESCPRPDDSPSSDVAISGMEIRSIAPLLSSYGDATTFIHKTFLYKKDIFRNIYLCS